MIAGGVAAAVAYLPESLVLGGTGKRTGGLEVVELDDDDALWLAVADHEFRGAAAREESAVAVRGRVRPMPRVNSSKSAWSVTSWLGRFTYAATSRTSLPVPRSARGANRM